jgi:hypothetical protein
MLITKSKFLRLEESSFYLLDFVGLNKRRKNQIILFP